MKMAVRNSGQKGDERRKHLVRVLLASGGSRGPPVRRRVRRTSCENKKPKMGNVAKVINNTGPNTINVNPCLATLNIIYRQPC